MRNIIILLVVFLLSFAPGNAREIDPESSQKAQFPLEVSFINHAVALPFSGLGLSPLHPGFSLGTEYAYLQGRRGRFFQGLKTGYYYNKYNAKALFLQTGVGYRYTLGFGLFADAEAGIGVLHSFHPREIFAQNADGEYEHVADPGKSSFIVSAALGLGYDLKTATGWPVGVFIRYQPYLQTPYSLESSIFPQTLFYIGIRIQPWGGNK